VSIIKIDVVNKLKDKGGILQELVFECL